MAELDKLIGAFEEFKKWEALGHEELKNDLKSLHDKVDSLRLWRASILGASALMGVIGGIFAGFMRFL